MSDKSKACEIKVGKMSNIKKRELLPCPFCGGEAKLNKEYEQEYATSTCCVVECDCGLITDIYDDPEEAINIWNTRAKQKQEEYKKYEFCKDVKCTQYEIKKRRIEYKMSCEREIFGCSKTAKEFHEWLKENNYKIINRK